MQNFLKSCAEWFSTESEINFLFNVCLLLQFSCLSSCFDIFVLYFFTLLYLYSFVSLSTIMSLCFYGSTNFMNRSTFSILLTFISLHETNRQSPNINRQPTNRLDKETKHMNLTGNPFPQKTPSLSQLKISVRNKSVTLFFCSTSKQYS